MITFVFPLLHGLVRIKRRARCFETLWITTPIKGRKCNYTVTRKYDIECWEKYDPVLPKGVVIHSVSKHNNANYAETHGTIGEYWELHIWHCVQYQLCWDTWYNWQVLGVAFSALYTTPIMLRHMVQLGSNGSAYLALCTMPTMLRHMVQLGSIGIAHLALYTMPIMPRHMLNWEVLGLHIWHCTQCQICRDTCWIGKY